MIVIIGYPIEDNKPTCIWTCVAQNQRVMQGNQGVYQKVVDKAENLIKLWGDTHG